MSSFSMIGRGVLGGFLAVAVAGGAGGRPARADRGEDTATLMARADAAQTRADMARERADKLEAQKGWVFKSGLIEHANRDAARYQAEADRARAEAYGVPPAGAPPLSPELEAAQNRVDELKFQAGWAYKGGKHVQSAENEVRALSGQPAAGVSVPAAVEQQEKENAIKADPSDSDKPVMKTQGEQPYDAQE